MAEDRCPRCFSRISDFASGEEAQWTDDPIKTPEGEAGELYKGFIYINPIHIEEIQQLRQQQEINAGISEEERTTFTPVTIENENIYFYKKHLRELRESTEKILEAMGQTKDIYFNYDEESTEYNIGNHQLDWKDVDLTQKFLDIKAVHIEDLRHYIEMGWFDDFAGISPTGNYFLERFDNTPPTYNFDYIDGARYTTDFSDNKTENLEISARWDGGIFHSGGGIPTHNGRTDIYVEQIDEEFRVRNVLHTDVNMNNTKGNVYHWQDSQLYWETFKTPLPNMVINSNQAMSIDYTYTISGTADSENTITKTIVYIIVRLTTEDNQARNLEYEMTDEVTVKTQTASNHWKVPFGTVKFNLYDDIIGAFPSGYSYKIYFAEYIVIRPYVYAKLDSLGGFLTKSATSDLTFTINQIKFPMPKG